MVVVVSLLLFRLAGLIFFCQGEELDMVVFFCFFPMRFGLLVVGQSGWSNLQRGEIALWTRTFQQLLRVSLFRVGPPGRAVFSRAAVLSLLRGDLQYARGR